MPIVDISIESNHPVFAGHFPQRPIVPGVLLLARTLREIETKTELKFAGIPAVKFLSPSAPNDVLELDYEVAESAVHFEIRCGTRRIATGRFQIMPDSVA